MRHTSDLENDLVGLKALPPQSCPDVDRMLKTLASEGRDAGKAAGTTEDADACSALEHAASAIVDAAEALDNERDVAAALRAGCDARESIIRAAVRMCEERDERIETLEAEVGERDALIDTYTTLRADTELLVLNLNEIIELQRRQAEISERVVVHLGEKIRKSWWTKMADTGKRLWWERKARGRAKKIRQLRAELVDMNWRNAELYDALLLADGILVQIEQEEGPFGETWCPHCHAMDGGGVFSRGLKHEPGCRIGKACEIIRWALVGEGRQHGMDPKGFEPKRREFQV